MSIVYINGIETGGMTGAGGQFTSTAGTAATETTIIRPGGGAYSAKLTGSSTLSGLAKTLTSAAAYWVRAWMYVHVTTAPAADQDRACISFTSTAGTGGTQIAAATLVTKTDGTAQFVLEDSQGAGFGSQVSLSLDTWHKVEFAVTNLSTTVGAAILRLDGVEIANTAVANTGVANIVSLLCRSYCPSGSASILIYFDDITVDNAQFPASDGIIMSRQGVAGTPTYDDFTKTGQATSALCWSDIPQSASNNCNSATSGANQTMNVAPFNAVQTGHGAGFTLPGWTVNAAQVVMSAKVSTGSAHSIRRVIGGVVTDTSKTLTTSDANYDDGIWTTSLANLNTAEAGVAHGADTNTVTVEEVWVQADVSPQVNAVIAPIYPIVPVEPI